MRLEIEKEGKTHRKIWDVYEFTNAKFAQLSGRGHSIALDECGERGRAIFVCWRNLQLRPILSVQLLVVVLQLGNDVGNNVMVNVVR